MKKLGLLRIAPGGFSGSIPLQGETIILLLAAIVSCGGNTCTVMMNSVKGEMNVAAVSVYSGLKFWLPSTWQDFASCNHTLPCGCLKAMLYAVTWLEGAGAELSYVPSGLSSASLCVCPSGFQAQHTDILRLSTLCMS